MTAVMISIGQWQFYPEYMAARNVHNGTWAVVLPSHNGWVVSCYSCPADWMLKELGEWLSSWMRGK